ncbi:hypothetical protein R1sor_023825 [Riccia sorocarpa]|uniref:Amino acid transporter n=1 Tax=Riccia sorocarpa TaxID=122646 RepID=A0ABD3GUN4_9MARC
MMASEVGVSTGVAEEAPVEPRDDGSPELQFLLPSNSIKLRRELSLIDALSITVGIVIGSGIFTSPGAVLAYAGSVGEGLLSWVAAGIMALFSALLFAELGASIPVASGSGAYFKVAFGDAWSFAFVWIMFFAIMPGSVNLIAASFAQYVVASMFSAEIVHGELNGDVWVKYTAILCIVILTLFSCAGVRVGSLLQNLLGLCKLALVGMIVMLGIIFFVKDSSVLKENLTEPFKGSSVAGFGPSMVAALWAFCGWGDIVFLAEEIKEPEKNIPRASFGAIAIVTFTYLIVNISYIAVLPYADVESSLVVAMDTARAVLGPTGGRLTAILVAVSLLGTLNAVIMCGGRYLYGSARTGEAPRWLGHVSQRTGAPTIALLAQGAWCVFLLFLFSDFLQILNYFGTASFFIYGLSAVAHIQIRRKLPDLHRPYKVPYHPFAPAVVICFSLYMIVSTVTNDPVHSAFAFLFMILAFPIYYLVFRGAQDRSWTRLPPSSHH